MELTGTLQDVTGSVKSGMTAYKLVVSIYWLVDEIEAYEIMTSFIDCVSSNLFIKAQTTSKHCTHDEGTQNRPIY